MQSRHSAVGLIFDHQSIFPSHIASPRVYKGGWKFSYWPARSSGGNKTAGPRGLAAARGPIFARPRIPRNCGSRIVGDRGLPGFGPAVPVVLRPPLSGPAAEPTVPCSAEPYCASADQIRESVISLAPLPPSYLARCEGSVSGRTAATGQW